MMMEPGRRYMLRWQVPSMSAGTTDPSEAYVTIERVERGMVFGVCDGGARLAYLPVTRIISVDEA